MTQALITLAQALRCTGWSRRTLERKVQRAEVIAVQHERQRNGKWTHRYDLASLPPAAQQRFAEQQHCEAALARTGEAATKKKAPVPSGRTEAPPKAARALEALTAEQQRQVRDRLEKIRPMIDWAAGKRRDVRALVGGTAASLEDVARALAEQHGISLSTIWRWYCSYRKGRAELADRPRADKGSSRLFTRFQEARAFIENKYLNEKLSIQSCYEALCREWARVGSASAKPPSYGTVRFHLTTLPAPVVSLSREGTRHFNENHRPFLLRDYRSVAVNALWVSDHMQHDVFVWNDLGLAFGAEPGAAFRPYLTDFMDIRSRKIVGYAWSVNPSSESICSALRLGICRYGFPREIYTDNGKDYQSQHLQDVLTRLGIGVRFATKYHPQAKPNESWHRTLHRRLDEKLQPAYCGPSPANKPEECELALREHRHWLEKKRRDTPLLAASEFFRMAACWIEKEYNARHVHTGHGMDHRTPDEVFDLELPPAKRTPISPLAVAELFWKRERRQLREGGCVVFDNRRYEPADGQTFAALNTLAAGDRVVLVACDPLNLAEAVVYSAAGEPLGMLRCSELAAWGPVSQAEIRATKKRQSAFTGAVKQYRHRLALGRARAGDLPERDYLRLAAGLPVGTRVVTPEDEMFREEKALAGSARRRLQLRPAVGSDVAPYVEDVAENFIRDYEEEGGHGD